MPPSRLAPQSQNFPTRNKPYSPNTKSFSAPKSGPRPSREQLGLLMARYGSPVSDGILDKLWIYHQLLRKHNTDMDLTRLIGFDTIIQRHYVDCMILQKWMPFPWPSPLVDIGTGAGFPGLMIKLISPKTEMILSEPRPRRVAFLETAIKELGMEGISVFGHKFTSRSFTQPVTGSITRAFESLAKTLPRLSNSLKVGGKAIFMKGPGVEEELKEALPENYRLLQDKRYRIPLTTLDRALLVFERLH